MYIIVSSLVLIPGIYSLIRFGLRPSVDFTGGTRLEMRFNKDISQDTIVGSVSGSPYAIVNTQRSGNNAYTIRTQMLDDEETKAFEVFLEEKTDTKIDIVQRDTVGPILGKELLVKSFVAACLAVIAILLYVAYAFKNIQFGFAAIIALIHDVLVVFGAFSLFGHFFGTEVDALFMTAFLTTMSFSVHDTIVIFDRIREYKKKNIKGNLIDISDIALNETMGRSLINSFTIIFMLLALVLLGGETVRWFAVALLIGTITGTYSSPFVATPILLAIHKKITK